MPPGLLYVLPTSTVAVEATPPIALAYAITPSTGSGATASQAILRFTAPVSNNTGAPGVITWDVRLLVVNDAADGQSQRRCQGQCHQRRQPQRRQPGADHYGQRRPGRRIFEPLLHIGKEYMTAQACRARLLADNFNAGLGGWTISSGGGLLAHPPAGYVCPTPPAPC